MQKYLVSALVSTYNSERFIQGCLDDLMTQTLYRKGLLQIVVVDSGSTEREGELIQLLAQSEPHLVYLRTEREPLYAAWNRAIGAASGRYLTNANTDDRHHPEALEKLAMALEAAPDYDLVYADCFLSKKPNEIFADNSQNEAYRYPDFFAPASLLHYQLGPQPMWRKSVHERVGLFDASFKAAGDYDFNIRCALAGCWALHLSEPLGLYLEHEGAISFRDDTMADENARIAQSYRTVENVLNLYSVVGVATKIRLQAARALWDMGNRALCYYTPWGGGAPETNLSFAALCFQAALERDPSNLKLRNSLLLCYWLAGDRNGARQVAMSAPDQKGVASLLVALDALEDGCSPTIFPSGLDFQGQAQLAGKEKRLGRTMSDQLAALEKERSVLTITLVASVGSVEPGQPGGGLETAMKEAAFALSRRGHKVALVGPMSAASQQRNQGAEVTFLPFEAWRLGEYPEFSDEIDLLCFASGPDLFSYDCVPASVPKVLWYHHQELQHLASNDPLRVINGVCTRTICVSEAVRANLTAAGADQARLQVVPNGVDLTVFKPRPVERDWQRILFVGALVPEKNPDGLIRAFLQVASIYPKTSLHLVGSASLWGAQDFINQEAVLKLSDRIHFRGVLTHQELAEEYSRAAICVVPSHYESFSLVSLEAQACGCVPLVAEVGGVPETLERDVTGFVYAPNTPETLAQRLASLLRAPELLRRASQAAQNMVPRRFSWDISAEGYEAVFKEAVAAGPTSASAVPAGAPSSRTAGTVSGAAAEPVQAVVSKAATSSKVVSSKAADADAVPLVSVVITCFNYGRFLQECVESVFCQTCADWELIIVNDGSNDNSGEVARALIAAHPDRSITILEQSNSGHPAHARNAGFKNARGSYLLPLDADDKIAPEMLSRCLEVLQRNPDLDIAYTDRQDFGAAEQLVRAGDYDYDVLKHQNFMSYCALFRRKVFVQTGGYREIPCEDWEFWIRCGSLGFHGVRVPGFLFLYRRHDGGGRFAEDSKNFQLSIAKIYLANPELYQEAELQAAREIVMREQRTSAAPVAAGPLVSVIVPTYNRPDQLVDTLRSILAQSYRNFEIIVVNDCGADVEGVVRMLNGEGRISYLRHAKNSGLAAARNSGIRIARGKYIAYLDDDDLFYPDHLETLVSYLENSEYRVAYTDAHRVHQEFQLGRYQTVGRDVPYSFDFNYDAILVGNFVPVLCFMHEKECLDQVGGFDETLTSHEDWELWLRLSRQFKFAHLKKVTCAFTWRQDGSTMTSAKAADFLETERRIFEKHKNLVVDRPDIRAAQERAQATRRQQLNQSRQEEVKSPQLQKAEELANSGDFQQALSLYRAAAVAEPGNQAALVGSGVCWLMLGDLGRAEHAFKVALQVRPESSKAWCGLAMVKETMGQPHEAFDLLRQSLAQDAGHINSLTELLKLAFQLNRLPEVEPYLVAALRLNPDDADLLFSLAGVRYGISEHAGALEALARLKSLKPGFDGADELEAKVVAALDTEKSAGALQQKLDEGAALVQSGDLDAAQALYGELTEQDPGCLAALIGLGVARLYAGKDRLAAEAFARALKVSPEDSKALCGMGMARAVQERNEEAYRFYKRALIANPENTTALGELLKQGYALELYSETEPFLTEYLRYHPADLDIRFSLAGLLYRMGEGERALQALESLLVFSPDYPGAAELAQLIADLCGVVR